MSLSAILFSYGRRSPSSMYFSSDSLAFFFIPLIISVSINTFFLNSFHLFMIDIFRALLRFSDMRLERDSAGQLPLKGWKGIILRQPC